jgi:adhesin transport system outer membrane protein
VRLRAIALCAALVFTGGLTHASSLGLEDALRVAASEHPSVAARQSELRAALMKLDLAERQKYPGLVAQSAKDGAGKQVTTLRIEQPLWTGGRITGEIDAAQAGIQQAEAGVLQSQLDIMLKVVAGFTELGRIQSRQLAARSNVEEHARLDNMIQRRVESKVSPTSDSIQANSRLAQARAELNQLEALAIRARSTLSQATGNPVTDIVVPKQRDMDEYPLETLVSTALDFSPALRKLDGEHAATTAEMAVRRSGAYPQFKMRLDRTFGGAGAGTNAYLALDVQTGAGFATIASVKEAEARRDAIQSQMEVARRETIDAVSADWADLKSFRMQARDLKSQVDSTTAVFDSFVRQYAVGRKGWNDVLNAQREVTQARYQLADADWGTLRSALRLQLLTGLMTAENISLILVEPKTPVAAAADVTPTAAAANVAPAAAEDVKPAAAVDVAPAVTNSGGTETQAPQSTAQVAAKSVESTR